MPAPKQPSSPSEADIEDAIKGLRLAASVPDVQALQRRFDYRVLTIAWKRLDPLTRSTLSFIRALDSSIADRKDHCRIFHDLDDTVL